MAKKPRGEAGKSATFLKPRESDLIEWLKSAKRLKYGPGERLIRPDEINSDVSLVLTGSIRLIAIGEEEEGSFTLDKRGPGQLIGWTSLLRGAPSEFVIASTDVVVLSLPADNFVHFIRKFQNSQFISASKQST